MKDNYKELDKLSQPKSVDRHSRLSKRIDDIAKVIKDPDDRVDELEKQIIEMEDKIKSLNSRIDGLNYLIKQIIK